MPKLKPGTILPTPTHDKAITRAARSDPDAKPLTEREWKLAKVAVKLRLDPDLLAVLKATGPGWQTRANRILRERFAL